MNNRCAVVKVREEAVGPGVGKVPEEELEAPGADTEVVELRPPPAGARSRERLLSRYAVVVGEGTKELGDNEEGEVQGAVRDRNALRYQCGSQGSKITTKYFMG